MPMRSPSCGVADRVLQQLVQRDRQPVAVDHHRDVGDRTQRPLARRRHPPALEQLVDERLQARLGRQQEARRGSALDQQQLVDQPLHPLQLGHHRVADGADLLVAGAVVAAEQVDVAARDRDRRQQLVRRVGDEVALALQRRPQVRGQPVALGHGVLAAAHVVDHGQEHQPHQRHLGQLRPVLTGAVHGQQRHGAGRQRHEGDAGDRAPGAPHAVPVEQREADVDQVERHRLPAVGAVVGDQHQHRHQVQAGEPYPGDLQPVLDEQVPCLGAVHGVKRTPAGPRVARRSNRPRRCARRRPTPPPRTKPTFDGQSARGLPVSSSVFRPDSTIIQPWPETDSAVMGAPSSWSCTTRSRQ